MSHIKLPLPLGLVGRSRKPDDQSMNHNTACVKGRRLIQEARGVHALFETSVDEEEKINVHEIPRCLTIFVECWREVSEHNIRLKQP